MGYMTPGRKREEEQPGGGSSELFVDPEEKVCPQCRRELLPWEQRCPTDGAVGVAWAALPSAMPPPPAHLLDEPEDPADEDS